MREMTLGVDLSDVVTRLVVVDEGGQVRSRGEVTPASGHDAGAVRDAAKRAIAGARGTVAGCAVALPASGEPVPPEIAVVLRESGAGGGAEIMPIAAGTAAALAEQWCGAARGLKQVITFAIDQHVTAGILLNGEPWYGAHGHAASVSWLAMNPVEREDYRRFGALEAEIASAGIVRRFVWRIKSGDHSAIVEPAGDFSRITADVILQGARAGDGVAISVMRDTAKYIGMAVANLATIFDPEAIVLGGVIAQSGDLLLEAIRAECSRRLRPQQAELVQVVLSTLGHDAVAIGAARAAARVGA